MRILLVFRCLFCCGGSQGLLIARLLVILIGSLTTFANHLIGSPTTSKSPGDSALGRERLNWYGSQKTWIFESWLYSSQLSHRLTVSVQYLEWRGPVLTICRADGHPEALQTKPFALSLFQSVVVVTKRQIKLTLRDAALTKGHVVEVRTRTIYHQKSFILEPSAPQDEGFSKA